MKKILFFGLLTAVVIALASCSKDSEILFGGQLPKGMVLRATVDQAAVTRAALSDGDTWTFSFSQGDNVYVGNDAAGPYSHLIFTKGAGDFACSTARPADSPVVWYAYFPQVAVYFIQQSGTKEDVANLYALSGATESPTTGGDGLNIAMAPQVAILEIDNQKGSIDINVKNGPDSWVFALNAKSGSAGFDLVTSPEKVSLLTTKAPGLHYIAVPAGVQLCIKDGDTEIKSTTADGFTAGKYYHLCVDPLLGTGFTEADIDGTTQLVKWTQLWKDGPKWAEFNVGADDNQLEDYGGYYRWTEVFTPWGDNWTRPDRSHYRALFESGKCTYEWTSVNNVNGILFKGKDEYEENSVFLPASGEDGGIGKDEFGLYWTSDKEWSNDRYYMGFLNFSATNFNILTDHDWEGYSVRMIVR